MRNMNSIISAHNRSILNPPKPIMVAIVETTPIALCKISALHQRRGGEGGRGVGGVSTQADTMYIYTYIYSNIYM